MASKSAPVVVVASPERPTKNSVRFQEDTEGDFAVEFIGQIYIKNHTLGQIGFTGTEKIKVTVELA
jgi:hypothetical protein